MPSIKGSNINTVGDESFMRVITLTIQEKSFTDRSRASSTDISYVHILYKHPDFNLISTVRPMSDNNNRQANSMIISHSNWTIYQIINEVTGVGEFLRRDGVSDELLKRNCRDCHGANLSLAAREMVTKFVSNFTCIKKSSITGSITGSITVQ